MNPPLFEYLSEGVVPFIGFCFLLLLRIFLKGKVYGSLNLLPLFLGAFCVIGKYLDVSMNASMMNWISYWRSQLQLMLTALGCVILLYLVDVLCSVLSARRTKAGSDQP